jgi:amidase
LPATRGNRHRDPSASSVEIAVGRHSPFIGDAHACQGDGEVCGTAVEYPSTTTIRVDVIKGWTIDWPRLEREDFIMAIDSARPLEDATRIAYRELVL